MEWENLYRVVRITAISGIGGTGAGGLLAGLFSRLHQKSERLISLLLSYAAGMMTAVVCFDLLANPESEEIIPAITGLLLGSGSVSLINRILTRKTKARGLFLAGMILAAAIALHNIPEGMAIGASFVSSRESGLLLAVVIALHNIPEGMAVAAPLYFSGTNIWSAAGTAALTGGATVLGAILGYGMGTLSASALTLVFSFAAGAMLYVVYGELLPEALTLWQSEVPAGAAILGIITGMFLTWL